MRDNDNIGVMFDPAHPGEVLAAAYLEPLAMSVRTLAAALGVSHSALSRVVAGQASLTSDMAVRLEKVLGRSAESWLRLQEQYDLHQSRLTLDLSHLHRLDLLSA
ncbi:MAG: HigA family addiction module antidote protein [Frankiaceae bacterium]|jgi:addiction module HigA family antidote|nr:HigA family addiction module antidote protein [Frankiaceae bacterium]